jgi:hypothetical protein
MHPMPQSVTDLITWLGGGLIVFTAAAGVAYWIFRAFSEKWLTAKFDERLAAYKHEQQKELEELRFKISGLLDRATKLAQREFDVLPEAWAKLVMAHGHVQAVTTGLQQYPDIDRMDTDELTEFLEQETILTQWQKDELKKEHKKTDYYIKLIDRHKAWEARETYRDFFVYFRKNGIFIREELKSKFHELSEMIQRTLVEHEQSVREFRGQGIQPIRKERQKFSAESDKLMNSLEAAVQTRLWDTLPN